MARSLENLGCGDVHRQQGRQLKVTKLTRELRAEVGDVACPGTSSRRPEPAIAVDSMSLGRQRWLVARDVEEAGTSAVRKELK